VTPSVAAPSDTNPSYASAKDKAKPKARDSYIALLQGNLTSRALQLSEVAVDRQEPMVLQR